ncbi:CGNR zinc finger domain-containing protein [Microbispora sp. NPDC049125]|uniref:CGNR zinc finger domain-containing protein n=1 Tax=Microbispora sp. NPDC049125 TaxID=3154929 RepID=UPI0034670D1D
MDEAHNSDLRIVGGHPVLDLVNTVAPRVPGGSDHHEYLPGPGELLAWASRVGVIDEGEARSVAAAWEAAPGSAERAWRATLEIREAVYTALTALVPAQPGSQLGVGEGRGDVLSQDAAYALEHLGLRWAAATARSALVPAGRPGRAARLVVGTSPALLLPDRFAHAAVEFLSSADLDRLRTCQVAEGGCGWLFLDLTRNGSRRWCAMADCGSQAKARRLTERRRARRATG